MLTHGYSFFTLPRWWQGLFASWALAMIAIPIWVWNLGDQVLPISVTITTLLLAGLSASLLYLCWGKGVASGRLIGILLLSWLVEWCGATTDIPFGAYHYTAALQPQLAGVPLLIPFAWLMLLPAAWAVAASIGGSWHGLKFSLISGSALTAWDLFLDPQMAKWQFWQWENNGLYFGIPLQNYCGWLAVVTLLTLLLRPRPLPLQPLIAIYAAVWFFQTVGLFFFFDLQGPAIVGGSVMGLLLVLAVKKQKLNHQEKL